MGSITVNTGTKRKLIAVLGETRAGMFIKMEQEEGTRYVSFAGDAPIIGKTSEYNLEHLMKINPKRVPIYEGDSITIQF